MQHISTAINDVMQQLPPPSSQPRPRVLPAPLPTEPTNLHELIGQFEARESLENTDAIVPLKSLTMNEDGNVVVPDRGAFSFTEWSRKQCASLLGIRWDRWFENADPKERADELNRRFARADGTVKVRTMRTLGDTAIGVLAAFVSPGYTPIADSRIARLLAGALGSTDPELRLIRHNLTDKTTSYVIKIGERYRQGGPGEVGDVWGGLLVRNSGVGYASFMVALHLTRLLCKNGMVAPVPDPILLRRRHRGASNDKLAALLGEQLGELRERLGHGVRVLHTAQERRVTDVLGTIREALRRANLPLALSARISDAFNVEPNHSMFGISQAFTLAAQQTPPEMRLELERAASNLLTN